MVWTKKLYKKTSFNFVLFLSMDIKLLSQIAIKVFGCLLFLYYLNYHMDHTLSGTGIEKMVFS